MTQTLLLCRPLGDAPTDFAVQTTLAVRPGGRSQCSIHAGDEQDPALIDRWGGQTLEHLLALVNSEQAPASGCVSLMGER